MSPTSSFPYVFWKADPYDLLLLKMVDTKRVELFTDALQVRLAPTEHVCPKMVKLVSFYE